MADTEVVNCFIRNLSVFNGTHELTAFGSFFDLLIFTTTYHESNFCKSIDYKEN